ncbi:MAG: hypothetical protein ACLQVD_11670, partial [Capsulimonadaceae bacterium]
TLYSDGHRMLSFAYHVMPLNTNQLFGEEIVGYSSEGIFLNIPYYYHVSPDSIGTVYLRNSAVATAGITTALAPTFGSTGSSPGLAFDLEQTYSFRGTGSGEFAFNSLTRSDWGAMWSHYQRIDPLTNAYCYIYYPQHRSIFGSANVRHLFLNGYSLSLSGSSTTTQPYMGYSSQSAVGDAYIQSPARRIGRSILHYLYDFSWQEGRIVSTTPTVGAETTHISTQEADVRFATIPLPLGSVATLTDGLAVGNSWDRLNGDHSYTIMGNVGADRPLSTRGTLSFSYDYSYDPLLANYSQSIATSAYGNLNSPLQQTFSLTGRYAPNRESMLSASVFYDLPLRGDSVMANYGFHISKDWSFTVTSITEHQYPLNYTIFEFSLSRRVLGRSLELTYDTDVNRVRFDFGAGQF